MPIIRVEMLEGRTLEQKRELTETLTRETVRIIGTKPSSVYVVIEEVSRENWGVGGELLVDR